jgi:uncharacterized membrane protein (UPF0127 family)
MPTLVRTDGAVICERCVVADRPLRRMKGLLGRRSLPSGEGMLFKPGGSIHTAFMRFPIDVVFLDAGLTVLSIVPELPAFRTARARGAKVTVELSAGECARHALAVGDRLELRA